MGTKSPQVSELVYLFESVAFKINASIPAGINPVVNNNLDQYELKFTKKLKYT